MTTTIGSLDLNALNDLYSDSTQYFWFEPNASATYGAGAHVTLVPDTTFISNPTGQNILMNTDGFSIRNGLLPMMTLYNNSLDFNVVDTSAGTYVTMALFSSTGAQIGQIGESHLEMDYHSMQLVDREGNPYFYVSDLRDRDGNVYIEDTIESTGQLQSYRLSHICDTTKQISVYVNGSLVSDENYSIGFNQILQTSRVDFTYTPQIGTIIVEYYAIGQNAKALTFGIRNGEVGAMSVGLGYNVVADGTYSFAEGQESVASGATSHAEGWGTLAGSSCCHAEGNHTKALGVSSHAEGAYTTASAYYSHAEGDGTEANGWFSHAQNEGTKASKYAQTVLGTYNEEDTAQTTTHPNGNANYGKYAVIVGNGTADDARSNALTVDWNGKIKTSQMQAGTIAGTSVSANSYTDVSVTFSSAMSDVPIVVCGVVSTSTAGAIGSITSAVTSTSTTGFTCRIFNAGSTARTPSVNWIALNV